MQILIKHIRNVATFKFWNSYPVNSAYMYKILGLIFLGIMSRLLPHPPNFTAINAVALLSFCSLGNLGISFFTVFSTMLLSDLICGFHSCMFFVYLSFGLTVLMGYWLNPKKSPIRTTFLLITSSLLFFVIANFGAWIVSPFYPKTMEGLVHCYFAGIPFLANEVMGTLSYGTMLFGLFAFSEHYCLIKATITRSTWWSVFRPIL